MWSPAQSDPRSGLELMLGGRLFQSLAVQGKKWVEKQLARFVQVCLYFSHFSKLAFQQFLSEYMWPSFELDLEIIKTNILRKIHDDCFKNVTANVLLRFSADLAQWPCFWPQVTLFWTWHRTHQDNTLSKIHDDCFKNVTARVLIRFSFDLARWLFLTQSEPVSNLT